MIETENIYTWKSTEHCPVGAWRVDMENGTGFDVQLVYYKGGKIGVSIDRVGHFIFRDKDALIGPGASRYIAEKLLLWKADADGMTDFFEYLFEESREND